MKDLAIDRKAIAAIRALARPSDPPSKADALVSRVVEKFIEIAPPYLAAIQTGLATRDAKAVRHAAHTLKSSAANVGATMAAECAKLVENSIIEGNFEGAELAAEGLADALERSLPELRSLVLVERI